MGNIVSARLDFDSFYRDHFIPEHSHPANVALHIFGTLAGLVLLIASVTIIPLWWALLFPIVHVAPGLVGHRLFDRNEAVGDMRVLRKDFPLWWFLLGNHRMTMRWLARLLDRNQPR
jgi:hypothetical protein